MSTAAKTPAPSPSWERLERAADEAAEALAFWHRRATEAEEEVVRLRRALEDLASGEEGPEDSGKEVRRLRAENTALRSRMLQAKKRVSALLLRLGSLEARG